MSELIKQTTYTAGDVARILGVHVNTVARMADRGELERVVVGGGPRGRRITRASVEAYQARLRAALGIDRDNDHGAA